MSVAFIGMANPGLLGCKSHCHAYWELDCFIQGEGSLVVGGERFAFKAGDIFCQPPGVPHQVSSERGFQDIYVGIDGFVNPGTHFVPRFFDNANRDFSNILLQIYRVCHLKQKNWQRIADSLLDVLYEYLTAWNETAGRQTLVNELERILIANLANPDFSVQEALKNYPVSAGHFRRLFRAQTGKAPLEYLISRRIDFARQLLESGGGQSIRIKEVAAMAGFSDPYYFSRLYRQITGMSPSACLAGQHKLASGRQESCGSQIRPGRFQEPAGQSRPD
ncbi:MAG TPA: hypothetical protein DD640_09270 [Clostridiales bacterium]|nr:hypothetical protein [Clostridiales bacterium]